MSLARHNLTEVMKGDAGSHRQRTVAAAAAAAGGVSQDMGHVLSASALFILMVL